MNDPLQALADKWRLEADDTERGFRDLHDLFGTGEFTLRPNDAPTILRACAKELDDELLELDRLNLLQEVEALRARL